MKFKQIRLIALLFLTLTTVFSYNQPVLATALAEPPKLDGAFIGNLIDKLQGLLIPVSVIIALALIILSGYMWISSAGDPEKVKKASSTLTWAIIGLVFIILIVLIFKLVMNFILK